MRPSLPGRAEVFFYKYRYLRGLLIVLVVYTLCGALDLQSVELQRSLGDTAVRDSTLESEILFVQKVCDRTLQY